MRPEVETGSMGASRLRLAGVGVVVAALAAVAPTAADAGSMYVHSARSGEFAGGRLTLHGVGRNVTWITTGGRAGVAPITRAHKRLFSPKTPATGALHIAGQRGGEEFAVRLSDPRYSAARRTVSYRATRLTKRADAARAAAAAPRRFGAASLSVVPDPSLGSGDGGNNCVMILRNSPPGNGSARLELLSSSKWDTDDWAPSPPDFIDVNGQAFVGTAGGIWRGCHNETVWDAGIGNRSATVTIDITWPWQQGPTTTCTSSNPAAIQCARADQFGEIIWEIQVV